MKVARHAEVKLLGLGSGFLAMNATMAARNVDLCLLLRHSSRQVLGYFGNVQVFQAVQVQHDCDKFRMLRPPARDGDRLGEGLTSFLVEGRCSRGTLHGRARVRPDHLAEVLAHCETVMATKGHAVVVATSSWGHRQLQKQE